MPKLTTPESVPRLYEVRGGFVPSVTTVLKVLQDKEWANAFIVKKGRRELDELREDAAALGSKIHAIAERLAHDRGHEPDDPDLAPYAKAVREFLDAHIRQVIATELSLASTEERVGGTMDLVAEMSDGSMGVIDFKSKRTGGVTDVNRCQTAGYALLLREHGYRVQKRIVVRLHTSEEKRGKWYARSCPNHEADVRAFRAAVEIWHWRHGRKLERKTA